MATIYDGSRVWSSVANTTAILAADHNLLQDKMILGFEERSIGVSIFEGAKNTVGASHWVLYNTESAPAPNWRNSTNTHAHDLCFAFSHLRSDQRITEISVEINGASTGGSIKLYRKEFDSTALVEMQDIGGADPWNVGGGPTTYTQSGLSIDAVAGESYFLNFKAPTSGAGLSLVYAMFYKSMFHKGS